MGSEFSIEETTAGTKAAVLRVGGRLDAKNAQHLLGACRAARTKGFRHVVVNLADVTFVASSGIGTLLALTEELREAGGTLHLVSLSSPVTSVVELLNLGQFLNIEESETEAVAAVEA